jgi:hypothetical protein
MQPLPRKHSAFTLAEMVVAAGVTVLVGGIIFALLSIGVTLFAQNTSINQTHAGGLASTEKLLVKLAAAAETPVLVNDAGAPIAGNGPAAGVRFFSPASSRACPVPSAVSATATSFTINTSGNQPAPQTGDKIAMSDLGFQGIITSVSSSGSSHTVGFAGTVGAGFSPAKTSGTVIPADSKCFVLIPSAFISVDAVLRYYPRALSVATDGAPAFNDPARFDPMTMLLPVNPQTNCFPFQNLDPGKRSLDVNLRLRASAHGSRVGGFFTFHNMRTTVAYRAANG